MQSLINRLTDIFERSMTQPLPSSVDPSLACKMEAIQHLQASADDGLSVAQKASMVSLFMKDVVAANTYLVLTDVDVRREWMMQLLGSVQVEG
jgi:hypothetical protein